MSAQQVARTFVERITARRESLGISQSELASRMATRGFAFHQTTVKRIEAGEREVRFSEAIALADSLGANLADLVDLTSLEWDRAHVRIDRAAELLEAVAANLRNGGAA